MDPLSVGASIAGLIAITAQLSSTLKSVINKARDVPDMIDHIKIEVDSINLALQQLRDLIIRKSLANPSKPTLITLETLLAILAGCMWTFSELERTVDKYFSSGKLTLQQKLAWFIKADSVSSLLERLQHHKTSLIFMLSITQSHSQLEAEQASEKLQKYVELLLADNDVLKQRLSQVNVHPTSSEVKDGHDHSSSGANGPELESLRPETNTRATFVPSSISFSFEAELLSSSVYSRSHRRADDWSLSRQSLTTGQICRSILSSVSISNISNLATFPIPVYPSDIGNTAKYNFPESYPRATKPSLTGQNSGPSASEIIGRPLDFVCKQAGIDLHFRDFRSGRPCKRRVPIILATLYDFILSHNIVAGALRKFAAKEISDEIPLESQNQVSRLMKHFNTPPYTVNLQNQGASLEDAIYCLMQFFKHLPEPLIPEKCTELIGSTFGETAHFHSSACQSSSKQQLAYGDLPIKMRAMIQQIIFRLSLVSQDSVEFTLYFVNQLAERNILSGNIHDVATMFTPFILSKTFLFGEDETEEYESEDEHSARNCLPCVCVMMALRLRNEIRIIETDEDIGASGERERLQPAYVATGLDGIAQYRLNEVGPGCRIKDDGNPNRLKRWFSISQQSVGRPAAQSTSRKELNFDTVAEGQMDETIAKKYHTEPRSYQPLSGPSALAQLKKKSVFLDRFRLARVRRAWAG